MTSSTGSWPAPITCCRSAGIGRESAAAWRTAQATAILRRGILKVTSDAQMVEMPSRPIRAPLIAPSLLRTYGLRSALIFVAMLLSLGAGTLMLRQAVTAPIIGPRTMDQLNGSMRALALTLSSDQLKRLDEIFPGPGGPAPEAYAW